MSDQFHDRVLETSTTSGTGNLVLEGTKQGFQSFSITKPGVLFNYVINDEKGNWEVGLGLHNKNNNELERTSILASSNVLKSPNSTFFVVGDANADGGDTVLKFDLQGNKIAGADVTNGAAVSSTATDFNENIYVGTDNGDLFKLNKDLAQQWSFTGHSNSINAIDVDSGSNVFTASKDGFVKKITSSGNEDWSLSKGGSITSLTLNPNNEIYIGTDDNEVKKLANADGSTNWTFTGHTSTLQTVVATNTAVFSGGVDKTIRRLDPDTGSEQWVFTGHTDWVRDLAADENDNVYSASLDNTARKTDSNGNQVWNFDAGVKQETINLDSDGFVYFAGSGGKVTKVDQNKNLQYTVDTVFTSIGPNSLGITPGVISSRAPQKVNFDTSEKLVFLTQAASSIPVNTDGLKEGALNLYYTSARASSDAPVQSVEGQTGDIDVLAADVGLGNVPNEDATDPANWNQDGAADADQFQWDNANGRWATFTPSGGGGGDLTQLPVNAIGQTSSNQTLDLSANSVFELEPTADITIDVTGLTSGARASAFLHLINGGDQNLTFGSKIKWPGGSVPAFSTKTNTPFDISTASFDDKLFDVSSQDTEVNGLGLKDDGSKMYVAGGNTESILQYGLEVPLKVETAFFEKSLDVSPYETGPQDVTFNDDGTKMYVTGSASDRIRQFGLTIAYEVDTASLEKSFDVGSEDNVPTGVKFKDGGTKMYLTGAFNTNIYQYSLTTGFEVDTATLEKTLDVSFNVSFPSDVEFDEIGEKMHVLDANNNVVHQYLLTTALEIDTASYDTSFDLSNQDFTPGGLVFSSTGGEMLMLGSFDENVYQYSIVTSSVDIIALHQHSTDTVAAETTHKDVTV